MKINGRDYTATPIPATGQAGATVRIDVRSYGFSLGSEYATPDQARELAAQLQLAANVAEGKQA